MSKPVRWGHVSEINKSIRVGTNTFKAQPRRLKHLISWRAAHKLASHKSVRRYARAQGVKPSSNLLLPKKIAFVLKRAKMMG